MCYLVFSYYWFFGLDDGVFGEIVWYVFCQYLVVVGFIKVGDYSGEVIVQWVSGVVVKDDIWQDYYKWVVVDNWVGVEDGVVQVQWLCLMYVYDGYVWWVNGLYFCQQLVFYVLFQQGFQFVGGVEVVFYFVF